MDIEFWFANGDNIGTVYNVPGWGRVLVFDGVIDLTQPFHFKSGDGENIDYEVDVVEILSKILPTAKG